MGTHPEQLDLRVITQVIHGHLWIWAIETIIPPDPHPSFQISEEQVAKNWNLPLSTIDALILISAVIQSLQNVAQNESWQYLVSRPHPWRKQLYIKGRKLLASTVWQDMIANEMSIEEAAENWDLSTSIINEVIQYCLSHQELLKSEADEEYLRLNMKGVPLEPAPSA